MVSLVLLWFLASVLGMAILHGMGILCGRKGEGSAKRGCFWVIFTPVGLLIVLLIFAWLGSPTVPTKADVIGKYEIDRSFCPGEQADWQHEVYEMEITEEEVIVADARTTKEWRHDIQWFSWPEYRWRYDSTEEKHHMVRGGPAIIRESFGYYYVFESPLYGEVVFRKKTGFPWWVVWCAVGVGAVVFGRWLWQMGKLERALP